ncbi:tetratricopeptide repeat protein, partial [Nocardia sp.]
MSRTLITRSDLAGSYQSAGRASEATDLFEQLLPDCERVLGPDHPRNSQRSRWCLPVGGAGRRGDPALGADPHRERADPGPPPSDHQESPSQSLQSTQATAVMAHQRAWGQARSGPLRTALYFGTGSRSSRTARPIRPIKSMTVSVMTPAAWMTWSRAAFRAMVKPARSGV